MKVHLLHEGTVGRYLGKQLCVFWLGGGSVGNETSQCVYLFYIVLIFECTTI